MFYHPLDPMIARKSTGENVYKLMYPLRIHELIISDSFSVLQCENATLLFTVIWKIIKRNERRVYFCKYKIMISFYHDTQFPKTIEDITKLHYEYKFLFNSQYGRKITNQQK